MFDTLIIGGGLIGSAAARHLSQQLQNVAVLAPPEPIHYASHDGVFASHYDQGRITRLVDPNPTWAELARRSIEQYPTVERVSGVRFHHAVGCLRLSAEPDQADDTLAQSLAAGRAQGAQLEELAQPQLGARFPFFDVPASSAAIWETGDAGYVNPRELVRAQLAVAQQQGATIIRAEATALRSGTGGFIAETAAGEIEAERLLLSGGGFTNGLLPALGLPALDLRPRLISVLLARLDEREAERLAAMPSIIYRTANHTRGYVGLHSIYALPPIRYPDGHSYVKIGATLSTPRWATSVDEVKRWFRREVDAEQLHQQRDMARRVLCDMLPGLRVSPRTSGGKADDGWRVKPCVVTYTAHGQPYIDQIDERLFVAAGGCGAAAKSSDAIGAAAAGLLLGKPLALDAPQEDFGAVFASS